MGYFKYLFLKNFVKKPIFLIFFVTNKCNSNCIHCFNKNLNIKKQELTLEEINKFSKQLDKLETLTLSGGEPFLRGDLEQICNIFIQNNEVNQITIPTNGLATKLIKEKIKKIIELNPKTKISLNLSLDGTEEIHDKIRGTKDAFKTLIKTYNEIKEFNIYPNFSLRVNTTINNLNYRNLQELEQFIQTEMPNIDSHNFELMRGTPRKKDIVKALTTDQVKEIIPILQKIWKNYNFFEKSKIKSFLFRGIKNTLFKNYSKILEENKQITECYAGKTHMVLDETGNIYFCELMDSIGKIREDSFNNIWNGDLAKNMHEIVKNCYCTHSCFQNCNLIWDFKSHPKIIYEGIRGA